MPKSDQRVGKSRWNKIGSTVKKWVMLLLNPRFLLCFGIGWMITNGWAYLMLGLGLLLDASWAFPATKVVGFAHTHLSPFLKKGA